MGENGPHITAIEWGFVIGVLIIVDLVQIGLDLLFQVGVIINRFIDVAVGFSFALYLQLRGQSMANPKRMWGLIATFVGEEIPDVDALPFWTLDGVYNMFMANADKVLDQVPGGEKAKEAMHKMEKVTGQAKIT